MDPRRQTGRAHGVLVDQTKLNLQQQMATADALIATMEQQYNYLTGMFQSMQVADSQYK
jgi:hypothetical protein